MGLQQALQIIADPKRLQDWQASERRQKMRDIRQRAADAIARRSGVTGG